VPPARAADHDVGAVLNEPRRVGGRNNFHAKLL
jgi:hypothetical protein